MNEAPMASAAGLDYAKLRALLRLRFRTTLRRLTRERGRIVGTVLLTVTVAPFAVGAAFATWMGYRQLAPAVAAQLLAAVVTGLWLLWLIAPILTYRLNEGLDITRLLVYPIRRRDLTLSLLLGTLLDLPTYLALPLLIAVLVGWADGLTAAIAIPAVILAYGHMVLAGQIVVVGLGGLLRSRRFRDVLLIVFSLLGSSCYFIQRGAIELGSRYAQREDLTQLRILPLLQWLPPGSSARAIERAASGAWPEAILWLMYGTLLLAGVGWLWWRLLVRLTTGGGFPILGLPRSDKRTTTRARHRVAVPAVLAWLPWDIAQLMTKELRSVWRTPRRRVMMTQSLLMPLVLGAFVFLRGDMRATLGAWAGLGLTGYALIASWGMSQNMLGYEGAGLPLLLLTPTPRSRMLLGKGLALVVLTNLAVLVLGLGFTILAPTWTNVLGLLVSLSVAPVAVGVGAVISVRYPYPIDLEGTGRRNVLATRGGCATALANTFLFPLATGLLVMPPRAVVTVAVLLGRTWAGFAAAVVSLAYAGLILWMGTRLAGSELERREPEVIAATRLSD